MSVAERLPAPATPPAPTARWIEDDPTIASLLGRAAELRVMLAVGGFGGARNSLLLNVDAGRRQLVIDPPFPALAEPLLPGMLLSLSTRIEGAALDFSCVLDSEAFIDQEPALLLHWPDRVRYLQRRSAYRLDIPHNFNATAATIRDGQGPVPARLVDLSRFGAGALVPRSTRTQQGDPVACTIRIAGIEFSAEAEVRSCIRNMDRVRLGLQFTSLSAASAAKLSTAVAQLERAMLRRAAERRNRESL